MAQKPRTACIALIAAAAALVLVGCTPAPTTPDTSAPSPSMSTGSSTTPTSTASATPSETPAATPAFADCYDAATPEFLAMVEQNGWVGWNMVGQKIGHSPFDIFPSGAPDGQLSCRWGAGPEVATDNVLDLAWAPIEEHAAASAQAALAERGFEIIESSEGRYFALPTDHTGWADSDGYGEAYLFTPSDVRWAQTRDQLVHIRSGA